MERGQGGRKLHTGLFPLCALVVQFAARHRRLLLHIRLNSRLTHQKVVRLPIIQVKHCCTTIHRTEITDTTPALAFATTAATIIPICGRRNIEKWVSLPLGENRNLRKLEKLGCRKKNAVATTTTHSRVLADHLLTYYTMSTYDSGRS